MTPQEKAREIVEKFKKLNEGTDTCFGICDAVEDCTHTGHGCALWVSHAKECALIVVDEV